MVVCKNSKIYGMKRLYSYSGLYDAIFGVPIFCLGIIILFCIFAIDQIGIACIPVVPGMLFWLFVFRRSKKVYYERGSLYIYDIFSSIPTIVHKDNIGSIDRVLFYDPRLFNLVFYDENKDAKYVYFSRNWFLSDFSEIIDKLNG